jgi:hypothetical protein
MVTKNLSLSEGRTRFRGREVKVGCTAKRASADLGAGAMTGELNRTSLIQPAIQAGNLPRWARWSEASEIAKRYSQAWMLANQ